MASDNHLSRRDTLQAMGALGATAALGARTVTAGESNSTFVHSGLADRIKQTPLIDTHEHLLDERKRLAITGHRYIQSDDWSTILNHYLNSDLLTAGMPGGDYGKFFNAGVDPVDKWKLLEPFWPAVKNTGYGRAVRIAMQKLYDVDDLSAATVKKVQAGYEAMRKPGFYKRILRDMANIESCQVDCLGAAFGETDDPTFMMQDLSIAGMFAGPNFDLFGKPTGIDVKDLSDWHRVIDWWFDKYGKYAVAVKSKNAYQRNIDYERIPAEQAEPIFKKRLENQPVTPIETKALEDHLFWYAVDKATEHTLPVKLHTGYYAGQNYMPLSRLIQNPGSATDLCRMAPNTQFVFMHICYPYYEELISVAKHYTNAHIDMCWAWIINPVGSVDFLKKYLVTAPANKVLTFGGDYIPVEPVLGHAVMARQGITRALTELVDEGWLSVDDAEELIEPIMCGNARRIFNLKEKSQILQNVPWI